MSYNFVFLFVYVLVTARDVSYFLADIPLRSLGYSATVTRIFLARGVRSTTWIFKAITLSFLLFLFHCGAELCTPGSRIENDFGFVANDWFFGQ
jgi:hypothetical protein